MLVNLNDLLPDAAASNYSVPVLMSLALKMLAQS